MEYQDVLSKLAGDKAPAPSADDRGAERLQVAGFIALANGVIDEDPTIRKQAAEAYGAIMGLPGEQRLSALEALAFEHWGSAGAQKIASGEIDEQLNTDLAKAAADLETVGSIRKAAAGLIALCEMAGSQEKVAADAGQALAEMAGMSQAQIGAALAKTAEDYYGTKNAAAIADGEFDSEIVEELTGLAGSASGDLSKSASVQAVTKVASDFLAFIQPFAGGGEEHVAVDVGEMIGRLKRVLPGAARELRERGSSAAARVLDTAKGREEAAAAHLSEVAGRARRAAGTGAARVREGLETARDAADEAAERARGLGQRMRGPALVAGGAGLAGLGGGALVAKHQVDLAERRRKAAAALTQGEALRKVADDLALEAKLTIDAATEILAESAAGD